MTTDARPLAPCPFCGSQASFHTVCHDEHFIQCDGPRCETSTAIVIAGGDDPIPLLIERWNRRDEAKAQPAVDALSREDSFPARSDHHWTVRMCPAAQADFTEMKCEASAAPGLRAKLAEITDERDDARKLLSLTQKARADDVARLQQKCWDWGTYWRASDGHGVKLTIQQSVELLQDALGVEVEITNKERDAATDAAHDVITERERQKSQEGWTIEHDDEHDDGSMAAAAACYAMPMPVMNKRYDIDFTKNTVKDSGRCPEGWPASWSTSWWKPKDRRRDLVRAGALIIAEIERLDRKAALDAGGGA